MTYREVVYALHRLPVMARLDMICAANIAESYWMRWTDDAGSIHAAKAVAIEMSLIFSGALSIIECVRRSPIEGQRRPL